MRTVQMTLEPELVAAVDRAARRLRISRSTFTRRALAAELERLRVVALERRHREGYVKKPARRGEFNAWHAQQA